MATGPLPGARPRMRGPRLGGHIIERPRLQALLGGADWRIAVISAGPGAGKTVFAAQWLASQAVDHAWLTLDQSNDNARSFWLDVVAALTHARPEIFAESTRLAEARHQPCRATVAQLAVDAERLDRPLVLVLDDFDAARAAPIQESLASLVQVLPPNLRLVLATRRDPRVPLALWRARGWLAEIHQRDLNFDLDETVEFFCAFGERQVDAEAIRALHAHTEGWVSALKIAAIAMRDRPPEAVSREFTGRNAPIADLLHSEVLGRQSDEVQEFMLRSSIAAQLDAELCEALTGRADSLDQLRALEADTHFVEALDDARTTFRIHGLLVELLRFELEHRIPGLTEDLHRIAARVLEARNDVTGAIHHMLAAGDVDRAFELIIPRAHEFWDHGDSSLAPAVLESIPTGSLTRSASTLIDYALAFATSGSVDESIVWIARARVALEAQAEPDPTDQARLDGLRLAQFVVDATDPGGLACGIRAVDAARRGLDFGPYTQRVQPALARAYLLAGDPDAAEKVLAGSTTGGELSEMLLLPAITARVALEQGSLRQAAERAEFALTAAATMDMPMHLGTFDARIAKLGVLTERNDLAATDAVVQELREMMLQHDSAAYHILSRLDEVRVVAARAGLDAAFGVIEELRFHRDDRVRPHLQRRIDTLEARFRIEAGQTDLAAALIARLEPDNPVRQLLQARLHLLRGSAADALETLQRAHFTNQRTRLGAALLLVRAAILDRRDPALHLDRVVEIAAPDGFVRMVLEEGEHVTRLVRRAADASNIVEADEFAQTLGAPTRRRHHEATLVTLTDREEDVLRFLPTRLTNKEIAGECFLSVNTVKAHLRSLYAKLGVSSRTEAIETARAIGLL